MEGFGLNMKFLQRCSELNQKWDEVSEPNRFLWFMAGLLVVLIGYAAVLVFYGIFVALGYVVVLALLLTFRLFPYDKYLKESSCFAGNQAVQKQQSQTKGKT